MHVARSGAPSSGSPITPVEAMKISLGLGADRLRRGFADMGDRARADAAGEGVGVAGIDDQRARLAAGEMRAAPIDRRRGTFRAREDARDRRRPVEQREHDVGASGIAHARRDRRKTNASDRRRRDRSSARAARAGRGRPSSLSEADEAGRPALASAQPEVKGSSVCRRRRGRLPDRPELVAGGSGFPSGPNSSIFAALCSCAIASLSAFWAT